MHARIPLMPRPLFMSMLGKGLHVYTVFGFENFCSFSQCSV